MSLFRIRPLSLRALAAALVVAALSMTTALLGLNLKPAAAHDVVIGGTPEPGSVVEEFPDTVTLEFSGIPQETFNTVAVSDTASGEVLVSGEPELDDRFVSLDIPEDVNPGPGEYTVGFQITSSDGHATRGSVSFEVAGEATTTGTENDAADTTGDAGAESGAAEGADTENTATEPGDQLLAGPLSWIFGGLGVLVVLGVIVMMIAKNRQHAELDPKE